MVVFRCHVLKPCPRACMLVSFATSVFCLLGVDRWCTLAARARVLAPLRTGPFRNKGLTKTGNQRQAKSYRLCQVLQLVYLEDRVRGILAFLKRYIIVIQKVYFFTKFALLQFTAI